MIIRIVKMSFEPARVAEFLKLFHETAEAIRGFEGCHHLELYRDHENPNILFTYSFWESGKHLDAYRQSDLFHTTWARTKILFNDKPQAWSVSRLWNS